MSQIESPIESPFVLRGALRHYLKLGARVAGFNVDAAFGHAIDGLIVVDLARSDGRTLQKPMGAEEARRCLAHHGRRLS